MKSYQKTIADAIAKNPKIIIQRPRCPGKRKMKSDEHNKIFNDCINEMRMLIVRLRSDFIRHHSTPIPGVLDSTELGFYVDGGLDVLNRLDKTLELAYKLTENKHENT